MFKFKIIKKNELEDLEAINKVLKKDISIFKNMLDSRDKEIDAFKKQIRTLTLENKTAKVVISKLQIENDELRRGQESLLKKSNKNVTEESKSNETKKRGRKKKEA